MDLECSPNERAPGGRDQKAEPAAERITDGPRPACDKEETKTLSYLCVCLR
jgi:hypothetical protein